MKYLISVPVRGFIKVTVDADDDESAIDAGIDAAIVADTGEVEGVTLSDVVTILEVS